MRFTAVSAAVLAFASSVLAQTPGFNAISIPASVDAGKTVKITWTAPTFTDSDVKVELIGGPDFKSLVTKQVIVASIKNSALGYDWAVDSTLGQDATYGIRISLVSDSTTYQYSNAFKIVGGSTAASSSASASASGSSYPVSSGSASATASVSSAASSSAAVSSTVVVPTGSTTVVPATTSAPIGNLSTTAAPTQTTLSSSRASGTTTGSGSSSSSSVSVAAGAQATAGAVAMLGGLAVAMMAL